MEGRLILCSIKDEEEDASDCLTLFSALLSNSSLNPHLHPPFSNAFALQIRALPS